MIALLAMLFAAASPAKSQTPDIRIIRPLTPAHAKFVRITSDTWFSGVRGTEEELVSVEDGRDVTRTTAGILSNASGFDGFRFWSAQPSGVVDFEDHVDDMLDDVAWCHFYGRSGPEKPRVTTLRIIGDTRVVRLRYEDLSGAIDVKISRATGYVTGVSDYSGIDAAFLRLSDYRRVAGFLVPFEQTAETRYGIQTSRVTKVEALDGIRASAFAAPAAPHDWTLSRTGGPAVAPMDLPQGAPVVRVAFGKTTLRMLFDTGSSNELTPRSARLLGLRLVGRDRIGGVGAGTSAKRFAFAPEIRIGRAIIRDQVFNVVDDTTYDVDGIIGCEVLEHFAVRFDFAKRQVKLARSSQDLGVSQRDGFPLELNGCQPEVLGDLNGWPGTFLIDTGSASQIDVMAPFVREHRLLQRYHATVRDEGGNSGIGGHVFAGTATARSLEIDGWRWKDVSMDLSAMHSGGFDDPTEIGNVGVPMFSSGSLVFDYRKRLMWIL